MNINEESDFLKFPENGIIRLYNQFPRRYQYNEPSPIVNLYGEGQGGIQSHQPQKGKSRYRRKRKDVEIQLTQNKSVIDKMTDDLPRIANLGFNVVWINPIQQAGGSKGKLKNSLYAMASDQFFNPDFFFKIDNDEKIINYVHTARNNGLIPIFDIVLRHVARDSELSDQYSEYLNFGERHHWGDVVKFNYDLPQNIDYLVENLWRPFIRKYIGEYGFGGVRVDAITDVNYELQRRIFEIVNEYCNEFHGTRAVIVGELMVYNPVDYVPDLEELGFTHIIAPASFYWNFFDQEERLKSGEDHWLYQQTDELEKIAPTGGAIGCLGNHDTGTLKSRTILHVDRKIVCNGKNYKDSHREKRRGKWVTIGNIIKGIKPEDANYYEGIDYSGEMKERLFNIALLCKGGYYILAGDEFGVLHKPNVFDNYNETDRLENLGPDNLSEFIRSLNLLLSNLPKTGIEHLARQYISEVGPENESYFLHNVVISDSENNSIASIFFINNDIGEDGLNNLAGLIRDNDDFKCPDQQTYFINGDIAFFLQKDEFIKLDDFLSEETKRLDIRH